MLLGEEAWDKVGGGVVRWSPALVQLFSLKLGTSLLTWIICSKEGFGHWRVCEMK